jgi:hypothetical protein
MRPTRGRAGRPLSPPIRSCSGWGLPSRPVTRPLVRSYRTVSPLPRPEGRGGLSLWHYPSRYHAWTLSSTLPGGARTFLPGRNRGGRPSSWRYYSSVSQGGTLNLFTCSGFESVRRGEFSVSYRLWKTPHVTAGKTYRTGFGGAYHIEDVRTVRAGDIPDADLQLAGVADIESLWSLAGEHTHATVDADTLLYRVQLRYEATEPVAAPSLPIDVIAQWFARMDAASERGAWTQSVLSIIEANPRIAARVLAAQLDWPLLDFKQHVRRLKALV